MSSAALQPSSRPYPDTVVAADYAPISRRQTRPMRRRLDKENGRALEQLGHAIEYLIDSQTYEERSSDDNAQADAIRILSKASRDVFGRCPEVLPWTRTLKLWLRYRLFGIDRRSAA